MVALAGQGKWNEYNAVNVPGAMGLPASNLQSAKIEVFQAPSDPQNPKVGGMISAIEFALNPHTITYNKSAKWEDTGSAKNQPAQTPQFGKAEPAQISFEVLFDTSFQLHSGKTNVVDPVNLLLACCVPTTESSANGKGPASPPWLRLHWGQATYPYMVMKSVNVTYPIFSADGIPLRAICKLSLQEVFAAKGGTNPTSGALDVSDSHIVVAGDSLPSIAYRYYGNATVWRKIAEANGIDDPARIVIGSTLLVPSLLGERG